MRMPTCLVLVLFVSIAVQTTLAFAAPPGLQEAWSVPGTIMTQGQFDDDASVELLVFNSNTQIFEFIDGGTGTGEGALSGAFNSENNVQSWVADVDNDGRDEVLVRYAPITLPAVVALYDWTSGGGFDEVFQDVDFTEDLRWGALRGSALDLIENRLNDLVIRDMFGVVLFTASSDVPGWSSAGTIQLVEVQDTDADGLDEILVTQNNSGMKTLRLIDFPSAPTAVGDTPSSFSTRLLSYPNPSAGRTTIAFELPGAGRTRVKIYDAEGHLVRTLVDENLTEGRHAKPWDGRNDRGQPVAAGAYFYRLEAPGVQDARRMIRIR